MNVGYCTNIHSGATFEQALENLKEYAVPVKQAVSPGQPMGIGLWFSWQAVDQALADGKWQRLREFLNQQQLVPHTFNAFPFSDFHQAVVKHQVYQPDWTDPRRLEYTLAVARLQSRLLPTGAQGTISTLPLGWAGKKSWGATEVPLPTWDDQADRQSAEQLLRCAEKLGEISETSDVAIQLCLEPEPGCVLQTSEQLTQFFSKYLLDDPVMNSRPYLPLGVCHDICHAAVMFESQIAALNRYREAGIPIGKVQISSALELRVADARPQAWDSLRSFVEPRYLHQTSIQNTGETRFFEDLSAALSQRRQPPNTDTWRVHFHVPVMLEMIRQVRTTQSDIMDCLNWFAGQELSSQFEVETYAWEVSPESIRDRSLSRSLVSELQWLYDQFPWLAGRNRCVAVC